MNYNRPVPNRRSRKPWVRTGRLVPGLRMCMRVEFSVGADGQDLSAYEIAQIQMLRAANGLASLN